MLVDGDLVDGAAVLVGTAGDAVGPGDERLADVPGGQLVRCVGDDEPAALVAQAGQTRAHGHDGGGVVARCELDGRGTAGHGWTPRWVGRGNCGWRSPGLRAGGPAYHELGPREHLAGLAPADRREEHLDGLVADLREGLADGRERRDRKSVVEGGGGVGGGGWMG